MLYITCPTCGYFLGQKTIEYEEEKEKIFREKPLEFVQSEPVQTKEEFEKLKQIVDSIIEQSIETIRKQKKLSLEQVNKVKQKVRN